MTLGFNLGLRGTPSEILKTSLPSTKRQARSAAIFIFDPLDLTSPDLITDKSMLQDLWRSGVDWNKQVKVNEHKKWLKWVNEIMKLASIKIPRCLSTGHIEGEIHMFVDANKRSYTAAVYWRVKLREIETAVSLIVGKDRFAILKIISIPRFELQAALLGARPTPSITNEIDLNVYGNVPIYYGDPRHGDPRHGRRAPTEGNVMLIVNSSSPR
ncbi:hypothetical protein EVAR_52216_1 [Eumeta japonica]|uniref:DUF5641 domain-containing protein n=1 Tax=Eumeta variegata TaxID=151549 RepID=A0A4C1Z4A4_EUMVA|nr:hypothetical protein EVAR_52216_1 [Eumeta japonica]